MSQPPQGPWNQPSQGPWNQPPQPAWGAPPPPTGRTGGTGRGGVPLLVLGSVTALLGLLGAFLPSYDYGDGLGSFSPLLQTINGETLFLASGLLLLVGVGLLVAGSLLQRGRPGVGVGLLLVGAGMVVEHGGGQLFSLLQSLADDRLSSDIDVGGVLLVLAAFTGTAVVVLGLLRLARLR